MYSVVLRGSSVSNRQVFWVVFREIDFNKQKQNYIKNKLRGKGWGQHRQEHSSEKVNTSSEITRHLASIHFAHPHFSFI